MIPVKVKRVRKGVRRYLTRPVKGYRTYGARKLWPGQRIKTIRKESQVGNFDDAVPLDRHTNTSEGLDTTDEAHRKSHGQAAIGGMIVARELSTGGHTNARFLGFDVLPISEWADPSKQPDFPHRKLLLQGCRPRGPVRVLSLFDGIGTGMHVLQGRLHLSVVSYITSEVDMHAITVVRHNYGEHVKCIGSVANITKERLDTFGEVNVLLGGSPCDQLSLVNPKRKGLHDLSGSGPLFFKYVQVMEYLEEKSKNEGYSFFWLFENTSALQKDTLADMTRVLGCDPICRCSSDYVPMKRKRYYWGNVPGMHDCSTWSPRQDTCLQQYLKPHRTALVKVLPTLTTNPASQRSGKSRSWPVLMDGKEVPISLNEQESLFGLPQHYTDCDGLCPTARRKLLGKAWSAHVVEDILRPLADLFLTV